MFSLFNTLLPSHISIQAEKQNGEPPSGVFNASLLSHPVFWIVRGIVLGWKVIKMPGMYEENPVLRPADRA